MINDAYAGIERVSASTRRIAGAAIEELGPADMAAVVFTHTGTHQNFTSNRAQLLEADDRSFVPKNTSSAGVPATLHILRAPRSSQRRHSLKLQLVRKHARQVSALFGRRLIHNTMRQPSWRMGSDSSCALCTAVADATRSEDPLLFNRKLYETSQFVVVPSIGPIFPGHVLVVSKLHHPSLASMGPYAIEEYDRLAKRILESLSGFEPGTWLEAEHGATGTEKAGACVIHSHVHWIPDAGRFFEQLAGRLKPRALRLGEIGSVPQAYIFLRAGERQGVFDGHGLQSQTVRRLLCEFLDRDDDDWRQHLRSDWVVATVEQWLRAKAGH